MIQIEDLTINVDNKGVAKILYSLKTTTALNNAAITVLPDITAKAYKKSDGTEAISPNPLAVNIKDVFFTKAANESFTYEKTVSLLNFLSGLPLEQDLKIKFIMPFNQTSYTFQVTKPILMIGDGINATFRHLPCDRAGVETNFFISDEILPYNGITDVTTGNAAAAYAELYPKFGYTVANDYPAYTYLENQLGYVASKFSTTFKTNHYYFRQGANKEVAGHFYFHRPDGYIEDMTTAVATKNWGDSARLAILLKNFNWVIAEIGSFIDYTRGITTQKKSSEMDLNKTEFKEIAKDVLSISAANTMRVETLLMNFSHADTANEKKIPLTNESHQICFVKRVNVAIAASGTSFSLKINNLENAVTSVLQLVPEGVEGNYEASGYFATEVIVKGNITGQIILYRATKL